MKRIFIICICIALGIAILGAQEGEQYRGIKQVLAKEYVNSQHFGQDKMVLSQIKTGYYDAQGVLQNWILQQGNKTHLGHIDINSSSDAKEREILHYDYMNRLIGRKYERQDSPEYEYTVIEYDAKGKLLNKKRSRYYAAGEEKWGFEYNQVGYLTNYTQASVKDQAPIQQEYEYDYYDSLTAIHNYFYSDDGSGKLIEVKSTDPAGRLQKRVEYTYSEQGQLLEEKSFRKDDIPLGGVRYSYDEQQRLIQKLEYRFNPRYGGVLQITKQCDYSYL